MADTTSGKLPSVRDQITKVRERLVTEGKISPDARAATAAAGVPTFSEGTAPLDPNTGKPVVAAAQSETPAFTEGQVAIPEGTPVETEKPPVTKEDILAAHQERVKAAEEKPVVPQVEAGEKAAEAAAEAIVADEYEEFEWEDPDFADSETPIKFPIRVPKQYGEIAKRGYGRRAALDRAIRYAKDAEPVLKAMIADGRIKQVLPLIQAAIDNPQYGDYVAKGFQRMQQGLPLIEQARIEAAAAGAATTTPAPAQVTDDYNLALEDPFFAERVAPILKRTDTLQARLDALETERQQLAAQQQEQQRQNYQISSELAQAHRDLASSYPDKYNLQLQNKDPFFERAVNLAKEYGYIEAYGWRAGVVFGGQQAYALEQERLAATASPTATALANAESKHMELARQQAAQASRAVAAGSATPAPAPQPLPKPTPRDANGNLKPPAIFLAEQQQWLASQKVTA